MTEFIYVEPAHEHRPAFAAWGLSQERPLQTASATGWDVPVDLYPSVPAELLAGAYVDGYPYDVAQVQPVLAEADLFPTAPVVTEDRPRLTAEGAPATKKRAPRKRQPKPTGAYTRKPTEAELAAAQASSDGASDGE